MIDIQGFSMKNKLSEFTLKEFSEITVIMNNTELLHIERYLNIMETLGVSDEILNKLTDDELLNIIKNFGIDEELEKIMNSTLEIDGIEYVAYTDEFKMRAKDLALIEKYAAQGDEDYVIKAIATIFKSSVTNNHYDQAHLEFKFKAFENVELKLVYGYIPHIIEKIIRKIEAMNGVTI